MDAGDVDVVAREAQPRQVGGGQAERGRVTAHVAERDLARGPRARSGQEAVKSGHLTRRTGEAVDVDDTLDTQRLAQRRGGSATLGEGSAALQLHLLQSGGAVTGVEVTLLGGR